jgi:hypothetical protein
MNVTRDTAEELILDYTPWGLALVVCLSTLGLVAWGLSLMTKGEVIGGLFLVLIGAGMGAGVLLAFVERTRLWLHRPTATLTFRRRTLLSANETIRPLSDLRRAVTQTQRGSKGVILGRPVLDLTDPVTELPLTLSFGSGPGPERATNVINGWLSRAPLA